MDDGSSQFNNSTIVANVGELSDFISQHVIPSTSCEECDEKTDLVVSSKIFSQYEEDYGDIVIQNGGTFIVKENHKIFMGNDRRIIIESGGRLEIEEDAEIIACDEPWHGIEVQSGGTIKSEGSLKDVKFGVLGQPNSVIRLERGEILGTNEDNSVGVRIFGPNSRLYLIDVDIKDFDGGIQSTNNSGEYFYIRDIFRMNTNEFGIRLNNAASIKHCNIYIDNVINNNGIEISDGPASVMQEIYSNSGILLEDSPFSLVNENTIVTISSAQFYTLEVRNSDGTSVTGNWINSVSMAGIGLINSSINCISNHITLWGSDITSYGIGNLGKSSEIKNNNIQAPYSYAGVITGFSGDNKIENNTITTNEFGIACLGDVNDFLAQNIIDASSGIHVGASPGGIYECNVVTASNIGIDIWENSQGQEILANSLAGVKDLDVKSVLGPQEYHGNEFIGGSPSTTLTGRNLTNSIFLVNGNYSYHMPIGPNPYTGWFENNPSIPVFENCSGIPGNGEFWDFENEDWLCQYYRELLFNHGSGSPQVTNFLLNLRRVTETDPAIIFQDCYGLPSGLIGTEEIFLAEIEMTILNGVELLDSGMYISNSLDSFNQMNNPKDQDIDFIASISNDVRQQYFVKNSKYLNELDSLLQLLNSTTWGQNVVLQANVDILKEYIKYLKTDRTEYDYSTMMQLAQLCVIDYGRLVYLARIIALESTNVDYSVYDDCRGQQTPPVALSTNSDYIGLYPNPSDGIVNIRFEDSTSGKIKIRNIQGSLILDLDIHNRRQINVDLDHSLGINFVEIIEDNGKTQIEKVIIIR